MPTICYEPRNQLISLKFTFLAERRRKLYFANIPLMTQSYRFVSDGNNSVNYWHKEEEKLSNKLKEE